MAKRSLFPFLMLLCALSAPINVLVAQPANDDCFSAFIIEPFSPATGATIEATFDVVPPCDPPLSAPGVWYTTFGTGNTMTAHTCFGASYDTQINIFTGDCIALACETGNDNACGLQSSATWCSIAGQQYFVLVSGAFEQTGFFTIVVEDNGVPCGEFPVYTIPEIYLVLPDLVGQEVTVRAHATDPETRLLSDRIGCALTCNDPNTIMRLVGPDLPPSVNRDDLIEIAGIVDIDPTGMPGFNATFLATGGPHDVIAATGDPEVPPWRHLGWPAPPPQCDTCLFGVLISGGIDAAQNYPAFWKDLADYYCYKHSLGYCDANIRVFYFDGTPRDNAIPAAVVDTAESNQIRAFMASIAHKIAECKRAGHVSTAEVVVSNHGQDNGDINLWDFDWFTKEDFRMLMQQLIDSGATNLDIELGQCYGGEVMEELRDNLDTDSTNVTAASAADSNFSVNRQPDYSYWLNAKACALRDGKSLHEAIKAGNHIYDSLLTRVAEHLDTLALRLDSLGTAADSAKADLYRAIADAARDGRGREQYFHSIPCSLYCQADTIQVTPGGRLEFEFTGDSKNCGNCEVYCLNAQGQRVKTTTWNWNIPGSRNFQPGRDKRRLDSGAGESGIYIFHNNNGRFTVKVTATNPPHVPPGPRQTDPSNPEEFAGFSMGWRSGNGNEFSDIAANNYTTADSIGMLLDNLPRVLGPGGVSTLNVNFDIPAQNDFWEGMEVWLLVLSNSVATVTASCTNAEFSPASVDISGPGEYTIPLGAISGTGLHTLTLSADASVTWDCWALRTTIPTGMPPAVSDLVIQRVNDDIVLTWSAVPLADTYRLYTSSTPDGPWTPLIDVNVPNYTHVGEALSGEKKFYYVAAINEP